MENKCKLMYGYELIAEINIETDLERILKNLRNSFVPRNPAFELSHPNGNRLIVGISEHLCNAHYLDETLGYYLPVGDQPASKDHVVFLLGGHASYLPVRNCISFEKLVEIAKAFVSNGQLPEGIVEWELFK